MENTLKNKRKTLKIILASVAVLALIALMVVAFYDGLTVRYYSVTSPHVSKSHTYVVITDLHSTYYGENQKQLTEKIRETDPEAIFLVGDISEDRRPFDGTAALLSQIADTYPCYYVTGNHERWTDYTDNVKGLYEEYGITVLAGDSIDLGDGIRLHGLDDPLFYPSDMDFFFALEDLPVSDDKFDLLLSHRPEYSKMYASLGFDLTLCGHAHGGQVRLPGIVNGLYAPHQGFFPEFAGGEYEIDGRRIIVSRGLMIDELPRIFNPPELLVVKVTDEN